MFLFTPLGFFSFARSLPGLSISVFLFCGSIDIGPGLLSDVGFSRGLPTGLGVASAASNCVKIGSNYIS